MRSLTKHKFQIESKTNERAHIIEQRAIKQKETVIKYGADIKVAYIQSRLEYFIAKREEAYQISDHDEYFASINSQNINSIIEERLLKKEASLLLWFINPKNSIRDKYKALELLGIKEALASPKFGELSSLFLKAFRTELDATIIEILKKYTLEQHNKIKVDEILLSTYLNIDDSYEEYIQQAFQIIKIKEIANATQDNIHTIKILIPLLTAGTEPQQIIQICETLGINPATKVTLIDIDAIKLLASVPKKKLHSIAQKVASHNKKLTSTMEKYSIFTPLDLKQENFKYVSCNISKVIDMIKTAIIAGATNLRGIELIKSDQIFSQHHLYSEYLRYKKLADIISDLEVTTLDLAKHMLQTSSNNRFGYTDLFSLKILESIPSDEDILNYRLEKARVDHRKETAQLRKLSPLKVLARNYKISSREKMIRDNLDELVEVALLENLDMLKLHAKTIQHTTVVTVLNASTQNSTPAERVKLLKHRVKLCNKIILQVPTKSETRFSSKPKPKPRRLIKSASATEPSAAAPRSRSRTPSRQPFALKGIERNQHSLDRPPRSQTPIKKTKSGPQLRKARSVNQDRPITQSMLKKIISNEHSLFPPQAKPEEHETNTSYSNVLNIF